MNIICRLFSIVLLMLSSVPIYAQQSDSMLLAHFNMDNNLPSNNVYSFIQDRCGYIWFLTDNGIVKYNGYTFKLFNTSNGLPSNDVWQLTEDKFGRLWVHMYADEIGYIKDDIYHSVYNYKSGIVKIINVFEYNDYIYLVAPTRATEQFLIVDKNDSVKISPLSINKLLSIGDELVYAEVKDFKALLVRAKITNGLVTKVHVCLLGERLDYFVNDFRDGAMNVLYYKPGKNTQMVIVNGHKCSYQKLTFAELGGDNNEKIYVINNENNQYQLITDRAVYTLDKNLNLLKKVFYRTKVPADQVSYCKQVGRHYTFWATTSNGAFLRYSDFPSLNYDSTLSLLLHNYNKVGVNNYSTWWYNKNDDRLISVDNSGKLLLSKVTQGKVFRVERLNDKELLLLLEDYVKVFNSTLSSNKNIFDLRKPIFVKNFLPGDYTGFLKPRKDGKEEVRDTLKYKILNEYQHLIRVSDNIIYGATYGAVRLIKNESDHIFIETIHNDKYIAAAYDSVFNKCYFATKTSILVLNPKDNTFVILGKEILHSLRINTIEQLFIDKFQNVIIKDADKILVFNVKSWNYKYVSLDVNLSGCKIIVYENKMVVAGRFGIAQAMIYGPLNWSDFQIFPNISSQYNVVHDIVVNDEKTIITTDKGVFTADSTALFGNSNSTFWTSDTRLVITTPYQAHISNRDTLYVSPGANNISLDHINFLGKGERIFSYKIDNVTGWQQSRSGEISLNGLEPEKLYTITCIVKDNVWQSQPYTFHLYRIPYWYQRSSVIKIFWASGILLFSILILVAVLITRNIVAKTGEKKKALIELELRAIHSQINPHFIFNTLSSAQYFISKRKIDEAYNHVSKFSRLLRAYLKASRNRYTILGEEIDMLRNYIELQKIRFEDKFEYIIDIDDNVPVESIQIPPYCYSQ